MTKFTSLVRPFQLREYTQPRRILDATPAEVKPNVIFEAGKGGKPKSISNTVSYSYRGYMKKKVKERKKPGTEGGGG